MHTNGSYEKYHIWILKINLWRLCFRINAEKFEMKVKLLKNRKSNGPNSASLWRLLLLLHFYFGFLCLTVLSHFILLSSKDRLIYVKYLYFDEKNIYFWYFLPTVKRWANWVVPGRGNRILEIFGSYLALTALFGPTAGVIIDLTTRWQLLGLTNEKKRLVGCSICTVLNVCFGFCVCILRNCFLNRKIIIQKYRKIFK